MHGYSDKKIPSNEKKEGKMLNKIITVDAIIDDLLKAIEHNEDSRREMIDAEIITTTYRLCCY